MADAKVTGREFMKELCPPGPCAIAAPFSVDGWDCATNGAALLLVRGATFSQVEGAPPIDKVLAVELTKIATVKFTPLRCWGETAGLFHEVCDECDSPSAEASVTRGRLAGRWVNRRLIGHFLNALEADTVDVCAGEPMDPLLLETPDWKLYIMPMLEPAPGEEMEFSLDPAAFDQALWCVHIHGPDSLIAQPDLETAERRAKEWGAMFRDIMANNPSPYDPLLRAVVIRWPGTAETHAEDIAEHGGSPEDIC